MDTRQRRLMHQALINMKRMTNDEWRAVESQRPEDLDEAIECLDELRGCESSAPRQPRAEEEHGQRAVRRRAIADVVAHLAASVSDVVRFRQTRLAGHLVGERDVVRWIDRQRGNDGAPSDLRLLPFTLPEDDGVHYQLIARGGVLDALRAIGQQLADAYGWSLVDGVMWVLTGRTPTIEDFTGVAMHRPSLPVLNRLVLTVDPALTPADVGREYQRLRRAEFRGRRFRNLSEKHVQLGAFVAQRPRADRGDDNLRQAWNGQCGRWAKPRWKYHDDATFKRDCDVAHQRLLRLDARPVIVNVVDGVAMKFGDT